jgi:hypothetical protein
MMPSPTAGFPFHLAIVLSSSAPTLTSATSRSRTILFPDWETMIAPNSSGVESSPLVRTVNSRLSPSTLPPGISAFSLLTASSIS